MLYYVQSTGEWWEVSPQPKRLVSGCFSGNNNYGKDMNNPVSQFIHDRGPIPQGDYARGPLGYETPVKSLGFPIFANSKNNMGKPPRSGFFGHLANPKHLALSGDGTNASSDGCIVFPSYAALVLIANYPLTAFTVIGYRKDGWV